MKGIESIDHQLLFVCLKTVKGSTELIPMINEYSNGKLAEISDHISVLYLGKAFCLCRNG